MCIVKSSKQEHHLHWPYRCWVLCAATYSIEVCTCTHALFKIFFVVSSRSVLLAFERQTALVSYLFLIYLVFCHFSPILYQTHTIDKHMCLLSHVPLCTNVCVCLCFFHVTFLHTVANSISHFCLTAQIFDSISHWIWTSRERLNI